MELFSYIYSTSSQTETSEVSTSTFFCLASCRRRASIWYAGMSVGMFLKYSMIVGKVKKENISMKPIHQYTSTSISHWCSSSFLDFTKRDWFLTGQRKPSKMFLRGLLWFCFWSWLDLVLTVHWEQKALPLFWLHGMFSIPSNEHQQRSIIPIQWCLAVCAWYHRQHGLLHLWRYW